MKKRKKYVAVRNRELRTLSRQLSEIISRAHESHDVLDPLDLSLGALYALMQAKHWQYEDHIVPHHEHERKAVLVARADEMRKGRLRLDGKWAAGFCFNSALMRLDASFERSQATLKRLRRKDPHVKGRKHKKVLRHWPRYLRKVRQEVNRLKHEPSGTALGRRVMYQESLKAVRELTDFLSKNKTLLARSQ